MLLAEELALVAISPATGRHALGHREHLNACLAGLLVGQLMLEGTAASGDRERRVVLAGGPVPASPLLAGAAQVVAEKGPKIASVLSHMSWGIESRLGRGTWDAVTAGLVPAGAIGPSSGRLRPRHQLLDTAGRSAVVTKLQAAAEGDHPLAAPTALLNMTGPAQLLEVVAPSGSAHCHARRRIDHALDGTPYEDLGKVVREVLADVAAAASTIPPYAT